MEYCPHCMRQSNGPRCAHCGRSMDYAAKPPQLPAGKVLNSPDHKRAWLLGAALGQGGFGITYIGLDLQTNRRVAVKECFPTQLATRTGQTSNVTAKPGYEQSLAKMRQRFLQEAEILSRQSGLSSVVKIYDCFQANNTAYIVMEYLDGQTLQQKMQHEGRLPAQELLARMKPLMANIGRIHESGIIHRDITPDNVMWMPDGRLILMDFGSARSMENVQMSVLVKRDFAPVEQYQTTRQGPWTDVYGLSATIYYCITGKLVPQAVERLEKDTLIPPRQLGAELTATQEEALLWALAIQPNERPQNMGTFALALYPGGIPELKHTASAPVPPQPAPLPSNPGTIQTPSRPASGGKYETAALGIAILAGVIALLLSVILLL